MNDRLNPEQMDGYAAESRRIAATIADRQIRMTTCEWRKTGRNSRDFAGKSKWTAGEMLLA